MKFKLRHLGLALWLAGSGLAAQAEQASLNPFHVVDARTAHCCWDLRWSIDTQQGVDDYNANAWRLSFACVCVCPLIVMLGIFFVPESPRW